MLVKGGPGIKAAGQQGRHIFQVAGPIIKLPAPGKRAGAKIKKNFMQRFISLFETVLVRPGKIWTMV